MIMVGSIISLVCVIFALFMVKNWKFNIGGLLVWTGAGIIWFTCMISSAPIVLYRASCVLNVILIGILLFRMVLKIKK